MKEFDSLSHAKLSLQYHIVLATRYRRPCLLGLEKDVYESMSRALEGMRVIVWDMAVDHGDHVHLLIRVRDPRLSIGHIIMRLKQQSTYDLWGKHYAILRRYYWGKEHKLWSKGYFVAAVGYDDERVASYVSRQKR